MIRKQNKKPLLLCLAVIVLAGAILSALQFSHTTHFLQSDDLKQKKQETDYNSDKKEATVSGNGNPSKTDSDGKPTASSGNYSPPTTADSISIAPAQQGSQVVLSTKLVGYSDGTCSLSITNSSTGKTFAQKVEVIYAPDFSTCAGFSVPTSELGAGSWAISLSVTSGGVTNNKSLSFVVK